MTQDTILDQLILLNQDYHSLNPGPVPTQSRPTALEFSKQVNRGFPCIYNLAPSTLSRCHRKYDDTNGTKADPIRSYPVFSWTRDYLTDKITSKIEVAVTPDGRADALVEYGSAHEPVFLQPANIQMSMGELFDKLCPPNPFQSSILSPNPEKHDVHQDHQARQYDEPVYYLQSQNSNLTSEETGLSVLLKDVPHNFDFAEPVLGEPDAINLWIGDERSVTSVHRDPYENLYLVVKGEKIFTLWAPVDEVCMNAQMVRTGRYIHHPRHPKSEGERDQHDMNQVETCFSIQLDDEDTENNETETILTRDDISDLINSTVTGHGIHETDQDHSPSTTHPTQPSPSGINSLSKPDSESDSEPHSQSQTEPSQSKIPWIPIDPSLPRDVLNKQYPTYRHARPFTVGVKEGQILYLPAGWFHHVRQRRGFWSSGTAHAEGGGSSDQSQLRDMSDGIGVGGNEIHRHDSSRDDHRDDDDNTGSERGGDDVGDGKDDGDKKDEDEDGDGMVHNATESRDDISSQNDGSTHPTPWNRGEESPCIAINYWFDQDYEGEKYVMRQFMGRLVESLTLDTVG